MTVVEILRAEIRAGRMTRQKAINILLHYEMRPDKVQELLG